MVSKIVLVLLLVAVAVSGNPFADKNFKFIHRRMTASTNPKAIPFEDVYEPKGPRQPRVQGTVKVDNCGLSPLGDSPVNPAIVGGTEATPHSYPWQVALTIDFLYFCGGSVISDEWVMTAAHCMDGANRVQVVLGAHNIRINEPSQLTLVSTDFFVHENYRPAVIRNDIAMIKLPQALTFNDYIQPVCLPTLSDTPLPVGTLVNPSGWGLTSDSSTQVSDVLNQVTVPVISNADCNAVYGIIVDSEICIDAAGGKGTCNGDSGGPLNYKTGSVTTTRGIVSFGASAGCQSGYPDAFTRVISFLDWIEANTGIIIDP